MAEELFPSFKEVDLYRRDLVQLRAPSSRGSNPGHTSCYVLIPLRV